MKRMRCYERHSRCAKVKGKAISSFDGTMSAHDVCERFQLLVKHQHWRGLSKTVTWPELLRLRKKLAISKGGLSI